MREVYRSPWCNVSGYRACTIKYDTGKSTTILEHREVMAKYLGRMLTTTEVVHHKDGNKHNNAIDNLELTSWGEHPKKHPKPIKYLQLVCSGCGKEFKRRAKDALSNMKKKQAGPFCGRSCAGRYTGPLAHRKLNPDGTLRQKEIPHGTDTAYGYWGCRCDVCREGNRIRKQEQRVRARIGIAGGLRNHCP